MQVFLSPLAERKLILLLDYLEEEWSESSRDDFLNKLLKKFDQVAVQPESNPVAQYFSGIYKCVVTSQTSFYYRIVSNSIEVITLFDNRQNPEKLWKDLAEFFENDK